VDLSTLYPIKLGIIEIPKIDPCRKKFLIPAMAGISNYLYLNYFLYVIRQKKGGNFRIEERQNLLVSCIDVKMSYFLRKQSAILEKGNRKSITVSY
jgi:hypothetical protein